MSDDPRDRLKAATELHRKRTGIINIAASPKRLEALMEAVIVDAGPRAVPASSADPHYSNPKPELSTPTVRPWPVTAGPSEWSKVAPPLQKALRAAITDRHWPIYLHGSVGTGKTCAAACIYQHWSGSALWCEAGRIVADIIECRTNQTGTVTRSAENMSWHEGEQAITRKIRETSLLLLNDIGIRTPSEAAYEILLGIVDVRIGKALILTSNLDPDQLAKLYDDRIASRLLCGTVIHAVGEDRRSETSRFVRVKCSQARAAK